MQDNGDSLRSLQLNISLCCQHVVNLFRVQKVLTDSDVGTVESLSSTRFDLMSTSVRIANIVDELCRRQDDVLKELDQLDRQIEHVLKSLAPQPEPVVVPIPIPVQTQQKAA